MIIFGKAEKSMYSYSTKIRNIGIHLFGCIAFLLLPLIASPRASIFQLNGFGEPELRGIISSALLIVVFYLNYYLLIPSFFGKKKYLFWLLLMIACFAITLIAPNYLIPETRHMPYFNPDMRPQRPFDMPFKPKHSFSFFLGFQLMETLLKFLIVIGLSLLLKTNEWWKKTREEKRLAELEALKSQLSPHFLFNTLNGIYALALENSDKTANAIVRLSGLMRYNISEIQKDTVPLQNEIDYINNYIELQKMRLGDTVKIFFQTEQADPEIPIAPLLLISFVENAFKYGINPEHSSEISIRLTSTPENLCFFVSNYKSKMPDKHLKNETGINNVKRRLELLYPERHQLNIRDSDKKYEVELKLDLS